MENLEQLQAFAKKKHIECEIDATAYSIWLQKLTPSNLILVVGGSLLSLIAGASILIDQGIISEKTAGVLALISSGFAIVHSKLGCDHHQSECRRLKGLYEGLSEDYANLLIEEDFGEFKKKLQTLNSERSQVIKSASATPSAQSFADARKRLNI